MRRGTYRCSMHKFIAEEEAFEGLAGRTEKE